MLMLGEGVGMTSLWAGIVGTGSICSFFFCSAGIGSTFSSFLVQTGGCGVFAGYYCGGESTGASSGLLSGSTTLATTGIAGILGGGPGFFADFLLAMGALGAILTIPGSTRGVGSGKEISSLTYYWTIGCQMTTGSFWSILVSTGAGYLAAQIFSSTVSSTFSTAGAGVDYSTFDGMTGGLPIGGGVFPDFFMCAFIRTGGFLTISGTMITDSTTYLDAGFWTGTSSLFSSS